MESNKNKIDDSFVNLVKSYKESGVQYTDERWEDLKKWSEHKDVPKSKPFAYGYYILIIFIIIIIILLIIFFYYNAKPKTDVIDSLNLIANKSYSIEIIESNVEDGEDLYDD